MAYNYDTMSKTQKLAAFFIIVGPDLAPELMKQLRDPEIEDGQRVEVSATIQAPSHGGYYLSFHGLKVVTETEGVVQAVATRILPVIE